MEGVMQVKFLKLNVLLCQRTSDDGRRTITPGEDRRLLRILTHWGRVTHICVSELTIIGSDNGLSPGRRQAIIRTNAGILLIRPLGTNFSESLIEILIFPFKKMRLKVSSAKRQPFCLGLNLLRTNHISSASRLGMEMAKWFGRRNTVRSIINRLLVTGYRAQRPARCSRLAVEHGRCHREWVRRHKRWDLIHWRHCVLSGESHFHMHTMEIAQ